MALFAANLAAGAVFLASDGSSSAGVTALVAAGLLAGVKGAHMTASIGGADMPVVITLLNSYSGAWRAAAIALCVACVLLCYSIGVARDSGGS
jgi:NAD/NADP transhydrogenase beta subunit